jgi:outer membrane protein assembly factor BamA
MAITSLLLASVAVAQQSQPERKFVIRSLSLSGNTVLTASDKQHLRDEITIRANDLNDLREIGDEILIEYQNRGYFKTIVHDPDVHVVRTLPRQKIVNLSVRVEESRRYRLGEISFKGARVFSAKSLHECFLINSGDVFERNRIGDGLERLRQMYGQAGYPNFTSVPDTQIDEGQGVISLLIDIDEGKQFHWGSLTVSGDAADPQAKQKLLTAWKPHEGAIYDSDHTLQLLLREMGALPSIRPGDIFSLSFDQLSSAVNIEITLTQPPPL